MKHKTLVGVCLAISGLMLSHVVVEASITGSSLGTAAPPTTLGGWSMTAFPADGSNPVWPAGGSANVTSVPGPGGTSLTFNQALNHDIVGTPGWLTWSHGYAGDVYDTVSAVNPYSVTIGLPSGTHAFYLYAEPYEFAIYNITATAQDGTFITQSVQGNAGAAGYGFYTDVASFLTSIRIDGSSVTGAGTDFAIGEFGINTAVPEPSTLIAGALMLLPFGLQGIRCLRNRRQIRGT